MAIALKENRAIRGVEAIAERPDGTRVPFIPYPTPLHDADGNLIGLNFDRTWESTMSDIMFNPQICRNITVDIRYVLFIMDKFAGAGHLVDEMKLSN